MATYQIQSETLTDIADSIREKTGSEEAIATTSMSSMIRSITTPSIIVAYENLNDDLKAKVDSIDTVAETAESAKTTAEATAAAIPSLHTYSLSVPGNGSVKFSIDSNVFMFGRYLATAATASAAYVLTSYSAYRAPLVTELAAGSYITVTSGGDNTNGWYIQVSCTASAGAGLYLIGSCVPTIIS